MREGDDLTSARAKYTCHHLFPCLPSVIISSRRQLAIAPPRGGRVVVGRAKQSRHETSNFNSCYAYHEAIRERELQQRASFAGRTTVFRTPTKPAAEHTGNGGPQASEPTNLVLLYSEGYQVLFHCQPFTPNYGSTYDYC